MLLYREDYYWSCGIVLSQQSCYQVSLYLTYLEQADFAFAIAIWLCWFNERFLSLHDAAGALTPLLVIYLSLHVHLCSHL